MGKLCRCISAIKFQNDSHTEEGNDEIHLIDDDIKTAGCLPVQIVVPVAS